MENNKNIFEGAKFGDKFLTRDGRIALYLHECTRIFGKDCGHHLVIFTDADAYASNGKLWCDKDLKEESEYDIVSRYQEPIDEEKLDEVATDYTNNVGQGNWQELEAYKAGFRKAMEE